MKIAIIATILEGNAIGYKNNLLYSSDIISERFDNLTTGSSIVIGRKTYESLPENPFPGRNVIVLTRNMMWTRKGVGIAHNLGQAFNLCSTVHDSGKVFFVGGESVFGQALPLADEMYIAYVHKKAEMYDKCFPAYDKTKWRTSRIERLQKVDGQLISFVYSDRLWYKRHL